MISLLNSQTKVIKIQRQSDIDLSVYVYQSPITRIQHNLHSFVFRLCIFNILVLFSLDCGGSGSNYALSWHLSIFKYCYHSIFSIQNSLIWKDNHCRLSDIELLCAMVGPAVTETDNTETWLGLAWLSQ